MSRSFGFCLTLLLTGLLCTPCSLNANPAPLPTAGGAVSAKTPHKTIRMDAEEVIIRLGQGTYTVDAVYHMANTGESTTEWVGFPKGREGDLSKGEEYPDFIQFHAWIDGKKVPFSQGGKQWVAGKVTFPGHATTIIRITYEAKYPLTLRKGWGYVEYIVGTGSFWKGRIGRAIFTVDGSEIGGTRGFDATLKVPHCHKLRSENVIRIDVSNFKPERDATLHINISDRKTAVAR